MSAPHRIDVHQHVVPPFWAKALPDHGGDPSGPRSGDPTHTVLPQWSPELAIDLMDSQEIATGILSLTAPGIVGWYKNQRREIARRVNDYTAGLVAKRSDRFGGAAPRHRRCVVGTRVCVRYTPGRWRDPPQQLWRQIPR
jgi:predicted TIM-barrel fold metal-dependent hydrolase